MKNNFLHISINSDEISDNLSESIHFLKKNKVSYIEIRTVNKINVFNLSLKEIKKIADEIEKAGLKVSALASPLFKWYLRPTINNNNFDTFGFNPHLSVKEKKKYISKAVKIAKILKTNNIRVFSNLKQEKVSLKEMCEDSCFIYMLSVFKKAGVTPLLENETACIVSKMKDYLEVLKKFESMGLMAWWDIANSYDSDHFIETNTIHKIIPYLKYIHLKDKYFSQPNVYVSLGQGQINYKRIFSDLVPKLNCFTFSSIETHVKTNKKEATLASLKYLRKIYRKKRISYAIIGAGNIASKHSKALKINSNSELRGVYDIVKKKAIIFGQNNDVKVYSSLESLLSDPTIQVVNICTPHNTHIEIAKKCILFNKIVLSEKPFAISSTSLENYIQNPKARKNTYVVFQNLFNPPVEELFSAIKSGGLGKPQFFAVNIRWCRDQTYFKDWHGKLMFSGGSLYNQAIHSLQIVDQIFRKEIDKVLYFKKTYAQNSEVEDLGIINFYSKNGLLGYLEMCLVNKGGNLESSLFVVGSKGSIKIGGNSLNKLIYKYIPEKSNINNNDKGKIGEVYGDGHNKLICALSDKLLKNKNKNIDKLIKVEKIVPLIEFIEKIYKND